MATVSVFLNIDPNPEQTQADYTFTVDDGKDDVQFDDGVVLVKESSGKENYFPLENILRVTVE